MVAVAYFLAWLPAPCAERAVDRFGCQKGVVRRVGIKVVIDPIAVRIFVRQIRLSSRAHDFRWVEALSLPRSATLKHPMQDARPFSPELFGQLRVALVSRNGHRERDQVHAPLDGLVDRPQTRSSILRFESYQAALSSL
jgi:hypothetical protein